MAKTLSGMTDVESRAWVCLVTLGQLLSPALDARLRPSGVTTFELGVLVSLAETHGRGLRVGQLASTLHATLPHASKVVSRLEARGLVTREPSPDDARASVVLLSRDGRRALVGAVPVYTDEARSLILDRIPADDVARLVEILEPVVLELDPNGPVSRS